MFDNDQFDVMAARGRSHIPTIIALVGIHHFNRLSGLFLDLGTEGTNQGPVLDVGTGNDRR